MKTFKLIAAGMLAAGLINVASAATEIRITGSTAFRNATVNSIKDILNTGFVWGSAGGTGLGANQQVFVGTTKGTNTQVIIKTSWSGSVGGIQTVATGVAAGQPFIIDPTGTTFGNPATGTVGGVALTTGAGANIPAGSITESHTADVALSDAFQSTTPFLPLLTDTIVGVVPFEWVKGAYTPDGTLGSAVAGGFPGVTDMSVPQAQELLSGGLALNQFTSNPADQAVFVQCVGRDKDSGTRIGAIYDSQYLGCIYGAPTDGYFATVLQYIPNGATVGATQFAAQSAGSGVISTLAPWPVETVLGNTRAAGNEGFFSGGNVKNTLLRPTDTSAGNYIISYLGMSDANGVNGGAGYSYTDGAGVTSTITPSQNALTFGGYYPGSPTHPFGPPYTNVLQGVYTFWSYEHFLYNTTFAGVPKAVADQLATQLTTEANFGGVGILLTDMNASRATDGAPVTSP